MQTKIVGHENEWWGANPTMTTAQAACHAVENFIQRTSSFKLIGAEIFVVEVDDNGSIRKWKVETEPTFHAYARSYPERKETA